MSGISEMSPVSSDATASGATNAHVTFGNLPISAFQTIAGSLNLRDQIQFAHTCRNINYAMSEYYKEILRQIIAKGYLDQYFPEVKQLLFEIYECLDEHGRLNEDARKLVMDLPNWKCVEWDNIDESTRAQYEPLLINDYLFAKASNDPIIMRKIAQLCNAEDVRTKYEQKFKPSTRGVPMTRMEYQREDIFVNRIAPRLGEFTTLISRLVDSQRIDRGCEQKLNMIIEKAVDDRVKMKKAQIDYAIIVLGKAVLANFEDKTLKSILNDDVDMPIVKAEKIRKWMRENNEKLLRITVLNLCNEFLAVLPPEIALFRNLQSLLLDGNELRTLPVELKLLTDLTYLNLSYNDFTMLPSELLGLPQLTVLCMNNNRIRVLDSKVVSKLTNLKKLWLNNNRIVSLGKQIGSLEQLEVFSIRCNFLVTLPPEICRLVNLEFLDCTGNEIATIPDGIVGLQKLNILELGYNKIESLPDLLNSKIVKLYLCKNSLRSYPRNLPRNVQYVDFSGNSIETLPEEPQIFPQRLTLRDNPVARNFQKPAWLQNCVVIV